MLDRTPPSPKASCLSTSHDLVASIKLGFHGASDFQRADGRPDTSLALDDPVLQCLLRWGLQKAKEVGKGYLWHKRHRCCRYVLIDQEAAQR